MGLYDDNDGDDNDGHGDVDGDGDDPSKTNDHLRTHLVMSAADGCRFHQCLAITITTGAHIIKMMNRSSDSDDHNQDDDQKMIGC